MEQTVETAYLEIFNEMEEAPTPVTASVTSRILSGGTDTRKQQTAQSEILKVEFNPASLKFLAGGKEQEKKHASILYDENGEVRQADAAEASDALTVSMKLIFDRSIYKDDSVLQQVNGFMSIIQNPYVREVAFHWGSQYYIGKVTSINGEYTMFNTAGTPTRATIDLSILLN